MQCLHATWASARLNGALSECSCCRGNHSFLTDKPNIEVIDRFIMSILNEGEINDEQKEDLKFIIDNKLMNFYFDYNYNEDYVFENDIKYLKQKRYEKILKKMYKDHVPSIIEKIEEDIEKYIKGAKETIEFFKELQ